METTSSIASRKCEIDLCIFYPLSIGRSNTKKTSLQRSRLRFGPLAVDFGYLECEPTKIMEQSFLPQANSVLRW